MSQPLVRQLQEDGIAVLPPLLGAGQLAEMQAAFASRLRRLRWNDVDGYTKTEFHRHMVNDVLTLAQGFMDIALHPLVKETLRAYIGDAFALVEAKGWLSLPTRKDFHGWHGDAWYDQERVRDTIPREVKLALYLTDVRSGAFKYIKGSHGRQAPRLVRPQEVSGYPSDAVAEMLGPAGTAILFDTSGIHRQSAPILEPRHAVFLNYHDPSVPLQREDVEYNRYHPLLLNAALLGGLDCEDYRILGFGDKSTYQPSFERKPHHTALQAAFRRAYDATLHADGVRVRLAQVLRRLRRRPAAPPQAEPRPARELEHAQADR
jgi:hypothetical protein